MNIVLFSVAVSDLQNSLQNDPGISICCPMTDLGSLISGRNPSALSVSLICLGGLPLLFAPPAAALFLAPICRPVHSVLSLGRAGTAKGK